MCPSHRDAILPVVCSQWKQQGKSQPQLESSAKEFWVNNFAGFLAISRHFCRGKGAICSIQGFLAYYQRPRKRVIMIDTVSSTKEMLYPLQETLLFSLDLMNAAGFFCEEKGSGLCIIHFHLLQTRKLSFCFVSCKEKSPIPCSCILCQFLQPREINVLFSVEEELYPVQGRGLSYAGFSPMFCRLEKMCHVSCT